MTEYVAVVSFPENATTYQALSELKGSAVASEVVASALVERAADGTLSVPEGGDAGAGAGTAGGSLIGLLVGALGGPLGLLFGWGAGALIGSAVDADRGDTQDSTLLTLSTLIPAGRNALVLEVSEESPEALDAFASARGGQVLRRPLDDVLAELEAQEEAARAAQDAANDKLREQKKAERSEKREERIARLKAAFHGN